MLVHPRRSALLALAALGLATGPAFAGVGVFTDRTAWETAAGGPPDLFEDFNAYAEANGDDAEGALPVTFGPLTVSRVPGSEDTQPSLLTWGFENERVEPEPLGFILNRLGSFRVTDDSVTYEYVGRITAFGFDVNPDPDRLDQLVTITTDDGQTTTFSTPATDVSEFRGFVFDAPVRSITFTSAVDPVFGVDNVSARSDCPADLDDSGTVSVEDLLALLVDWGPCDCDADFDGNGAVDVGDLVRLLGLWGPCP